MYQLYYLKDACSLATHVVLLELGQEISIINKQECEDFNLLNPTGAVPVLVHDAKVMTEGAAIMLHILNTHKSPLFPEEKHARLQAVQDIMFANATMHPAYSKLFFIAQHISDPKAKLMAFTAAANSINQLWAVVEQQLADKPFLGGGYALGCGYYAKCLFPLEWLISHRYPVWRANPQHAKCRASYAKLSNRHQSPSSLTFIVCLIA